MTDLVRRSGRPARIDDYAGRKGEAADFARRLKVATTVGSPVVVHGRVWGMIAASSTAPQPLPVEAEARLADFAELVAIAISNAQAWDELAASRARVVAASDETRRRIERNLHDGTQQRLVALALELRGATADLGDAREDLHAVLEHTIEGINEVLEEVREISRGLHPAILSEGGLRPALKSLARRSPLPVELELGIPAGERFPAPVEVGVYYLVSEALTNAARHSGGSLVRVAVSSDGSKLRVTVSDDGSGGASSEGGSGLVGLQDRVGALSGRLTLASPAGLGTTLVAELPLAGASALPASR